MVTRYKMQKFTDEELMQLAIERLTTMRAGDLPELDALLKVMVDIFHVPTAVVSIRRGDELVFPAAEGGVFTTVIHEESFTKRVFETGRIEVVEDTLLSECFRNSPYVVEPPHYRFYVGSPVKLDNKTIIGALSLLDYQPHTLNEGDLEHLRLLSKAVEGLLRSQLNVLTAQIALEEAEQLRNIADRKGRLLEEVANVSGVGGWELDVETNKMFWTKTTREIHAVDDDYEPTLEQAYRFYAPEAQPLIEEIVNNGLKNAGIWDFEMPFYNARGQHLWVKATGQAVHEDGKLTRMIGAFQDVTVRRLMETRMVQSERLAHQKTEELSAIIHNMLQGVAVYQQGGRLKYWNRQYLEIFGLDEEETRYGTSFYETLKHMAARGETREDPAEFMERLLRGLGEQQSVRATYRLNTGRIVSALYSPLPDEGWLCTIEDVTKRERAAARIVHAANHDTLTKLANRTRFNRRMTEALRLKTENETTEEHILMMIDLDRFKAINDTHGHTAGDEVLKLVAARLKQSVRQTDTVARLGGDEFAIILSGDARLHRMAEETASRILQQVSMPYHFQTMTLEIGVSIGISPILATDTSSSEAIHRADLALYSVKKQGRNNYRFFDESMMTDGPTSPPESLS